MPFTQLGLAVLLFAGLTTSAFAGPIYTAEYRRTPFGTGEFKQSALPGATTEGSFFDQSAIFPGKVFEGNWFARANQGQLLSSIFAKKTFTSGSNSELGAATTLRYDDIVFSSDVYDFIDVDLPLHLSGSLTTEKVATRVIVKADLAGQKRVGSYRPALDEKAGLLAGLSGGNIDTTLTAHYTNVPTNTPVTLFLSLSTDMFINGNNTAFANFGSSYGFVSNGPAFIVPGGVNVNSQQAGIVNNQFGGAAPVPEPSSLALFGIGALGLFGYGRRRRKKTATRQAS